MPYLQEAGTGPAVGHECLANLVQGTVCKILGHTPKHGSWLNLVEGFFSKFARSVLRHIRVASKHELKQRMELLDRYRSGVQITASSIMAMTLDAAVAQAFQDVADAMADRERSRNEARVYAANLLLRLRGEAHALVQVAINPRDASASRKPWP